METKKLIIYGVGRFAEYASFVFENDDNYDVEGFCIEYSYIQKFPDEINNNVFSFEEINEKFPPGDHFLFIAVGNNLIRERIYTAAKKRGYKLATYISSQAKYWNNLKIGDNCFVGEGSVLQPFTEIGNNSILFSARIGHHGKIGNHVVLSACLLGGNVQIGDHSFLGLHSTVKENTKISPKNIIGMGVVISKDTGPNEIYSAPPAKKRNLTFQEYYRDLTNP